ncbi:helix-turn-helix transcriptional regulator [Acinetobacter pollinis]|uniref:Helix-turn-helix domain-containing protein n=1 Tax=Acinetobacter pollinis TaxID=2605270 RepID=A0ABU6DUL4_9GAMM|nr:helix-turn-helix domain-containing protein [Acinetobacter pollinis]MEB5477549.1 helix-turn-helix domain-containing protein [Acinetobacter pollinis]
MLARGKIGQKIRQERRNLGYTQQELFDLTGVNKTTISEMENGRFTGSLDLFERVLDGVGLQLEVTLKTTRLPHWQEINHLFTEDE